MHRRTFLRTTALAFPAAALAACTVATTNGVTTVTIDTAKVHTDGAAIITALMAVITNPAVAALLGPANSALAMGAAAMAEGALTDFDSMTSGTMSLQFDTTQAAKLVQSLVGDAQTVLGLVQPILPKLASSVAPAITNYVDAITALIAFVQVAASLATPPKGVHLKLTEAEALVIATH